MPRNGCTGALSGKPTWGVATPFVRALVVMLGLACLGGAQVPAATAQAASAEVQVVVQEEGGVVLWAQVAAPAVAAIALFFAGLQIWATRRVAREERTATIVAGFDGAHYSAIASRARGFLITRSALEEERKWFLFQRGTLHAEHAALPTDWPLDRRKPLSSRNDIRLFLAFFERVGFSSTREPSIGGS